MKIRAALLLTASLLFPLAAQAQENGYRLSLQETCMDISGAAMTIAHQRDNGKTAQQFANEIIQNYRQGTMDEEMLKNIANIALLVYDDWVLFTPTQIGVTAYRLCMGENV